MPTSGNKSLNNAHSAKEDEFYTQLTDIEKELHHYREHFKSLMVSRRMYNINHIKLWSRPYTTNQAMEVLTCLMWLNSSDLVKTS